MARNKKVGNIVYDSNGEPTYSRKAFNRLVKGQKPKANLKEKLNGFNKTTFGKKGTIHKKFFKGGVIASALIILATIFFNGFSNGEIEVLEDTRLTHTYDTIHIKYTKLNGQIVEYDYTPTVSYVDYDWSFKLNQLSKVRNVFNVLGENTNELYTPETYIAKFREYFQLGYLYDNGPLATPRWTIKQECPQSMHDEVDTFINQTLNGYFLGIPSDIIISRFVNVNLSMTDVYYSELSLNSSFNNWVSGEQNWFTYIMCALEFLPRIINNTIYDFGVLSKVIITWED